mmetsp:Transcript_78588/g.155681  ORF Transcript_78588/g.155681 Transcript_78588/m.155681 type:complete len:552 (+) Transcript_78588:55-1710(+)
MQMNWLKNLTGSKGDYFNCGFRKEKPQPGAGTGTGDGDGEGRSSFAHAPMMPAVAGPDRTSLGRGDGTSVPSQNRLVDAQAVQDAVDGAAEDAASVGGSSGIDSARHSSIPTESLASSRPSILSSGRRKQISSRRHLHQDNATLTDLVGRNFDFSTFAVPEEVEFRDVAGDMITFSRTRGRKARADFLVNGQMKIKSIHQVEVEGTTLNVEGVNCGEGPIASTTVPLGGPERDTFANRSIDNVLERRLDRERRDAEPHVDWSSAEKIIRQVLQLVEGLDSSMPHVEGRAGAKELELPFNDAKRGKEHEVVPFGGFLDMTPNGFKVIFNRYEEPPAGPKARFLKPTLRVGMYFYFDEWTFPGFPFDIRVWEVEQWRNGNMIWCGMALIEPCIDGAEANHGTEATARGCREPASECAEGQWQLGDTVFVLGFHQDNKAFAGFRYDDNLTAYQMQIGCCPPEAREASANTAQPTVYGHDDRSLGERLRGITKFDLMVCKGCPTCDRNRSNRATTESAKPRLEYKDFHPSLWEGLNKHPEDKQVRGNPANIKWWP